MRVSTKEIRRDKEEIRRGKGEVKRRGFLVRAVSPCINQHC